MPRVLVVDDSPTQARQIRLLLEDSGFHVALASQGIEALAAIPQFLPDLVVTDLQMPEMNGLELVEAMRCDHPSVPVILLTAFGSEEIAAEALQKGAASYVPKNNLERDIVPTVENILKITQADRHHLKALACLTQAELHFELENEPDLIMPIIGHLEEILIRLNIGDFTERMRVGVALQEAILNAMYHGNLEADFKLRQIDDKAFYELLSVHRRQAPFQDRRVHLSVRVTPEAATYTVRDDGHGFDPSILPDPMDPASLGANSGRGLLLIRTFMDEVYHNESGNEITLIKRAEGVGP